MKYDARLSGLIESTDSPIDQGAIGFPGPCRTYDANGNLIPWIESCDTETGIVRRFLLEYRGVNEKTIIGPNGRVAFTIDQWPAPLRVEPLPKRE